MQKTITVFGGTGFLGRHIIAALAKSGAAIRVATRNPARAYFLRPCGDVGQVVPLACDIHDNASVTAALRGATHAIYLPGLLFEKGSNARFEKIHAEAPSRVARIAKEQDLELLVHMSSLGASKDALSAYARTKAQGEDLVIHGFARSVILRPSVIFGPDDDFFNRFARLAQKTGMIPLIGGGRTKMQPVYVGDVADAVTRIIRDPQPEKYFGQIYELGGPAVYSFRALMDLLQAETKRKACYADLPFGLAKIAGTFASLLPKPPLTADQVRSLQSDNVIEANSPGLKELGITPQSLETILPTYLYQYWPGGRYAQKRQAE